MAFDTGILAGGYLEHQDYGTVQYKRVLAIRASVLATTDIAHQITFDADFAARWGFDGLAGMQAQPRAYQQRIALWARCKLLDLRRDFNAVGAPTYTPDLYYFTFHDTDWLFMDRHLIEVVVAWTEKWYAINVNGVAGAVIDTLLENSHVAQFGLEDLITAPAAQVKVAQSLIRLAGSAYENVPGAADIIQDLKVDGVAQRMLSEHYATHLHIMGWYAEGLSSLTLAAQRNSFNAFTQTDWGTDAINAVQVEMQELMSRLNTIGDGAGYDHDIMLAFAEMMAHGFIPEAFFQRLDYLPGESAKTIPGAVYVDFDEAISGQTNKKTIACTIKVLVPEGQTLTNIDVELQHVDANALFTHYAVAANGVMLDAATLVISNDLTGGIGRNRFEIGKPIGGWVGGVGGTVHTLISFDLGYIDAVTPAYEIAPRPYQMLPVVNAMLNAALVVDGAYFLKGLRMLSGIKNDGGRNYEFAQK